MKNQMKRRKSQIMFEEDKETKYEIAFFKLQSFLSRNYPDVLEDWHDQEREL